jgi:cellobiose-specific phosphotransferase system component IIC
VTATPTRTPTSTPTPTRTPTQQGAEPPLLDVDGAGECQALTDGLLVLRWLFGLHGSELVNGAVAPGCNRCTAPEIEEHLELHVEDLDADGSGDSEPLMDGLLVQRWLFGLRGDSLVLGAVDPLKCTRCTAAEIEAYLAGLE